MFLGQKNVDNSYRCIFSISHNLRSRGKMVINLSFRHLNHDFITNFGQFCKKIALIRDGRFIISEEEGRYIFYIDIRGMLRYEVGDNSQVFGSICYGRDSLDYCFDNVVDGQVKITSASHLN